MAIPAYEALRRPNGWATAAALGTTNFIDNAHSGTRTRMRRVTRRQHSLQGMNHCKLAATQLLKRRNRPSPNELESPSRAGLVRGGLDLAKDHNSWPQWENLRQPYRDWAPLVLELHAECEAGGGSIADYYVDGLVRIAEIGIPVIEAVEVPR